MTILKGNNLIKEKSYLKCLDLLKFVQIYL